MAAKPSFVKDRFLRRNSFWGFQTKKKTFFFLLKKNNFFVGKNINGISPKNEYLFEARLVIFLCFHLD
jgi:hypothetical protein